MVPDVPLLKKQSRNKLFRLNTKTSCLSGFRDENVNFNGDPRSGPRFWTGQR